MKRIFYISILIIGFLVLLSNSMSNSNFERLTNKIWVVTNHDFYTFKNKSILAYNKRAYKFYKDGRLLVRRDLNWCGNSRPQYTSILGKWKQLSDSTVELTYDLWGLRNKFSCKFKLIDKKTMHFNIQRSALVTRVKPVPFLQE